MSQRWDLVRFGDLFDYENKSKIKAGDGLKSGRYPFYTSSVDQTKFINDFQFDRTSLIFGTGGNASVHFCNNPFSVSTDCLVAIAKDETIVFLKYIFFFLSGNMNLLEEGFKGAGLKHISKGYINEIQIPLPPLATQKRIAEILDAADALRRKDQELLKKYDELAQAIFIDMFGDPVKNEKGWEIGTIRDLSAEVKYGTSKPAEENGSIPYLRMNNITFSGDWDISNLKFINLEKDEFEKYIVKDRDLVFNRTNSKELVGKTAVFNLSKEMAIAGYLIRLRTNNKANPYYISSYLNSKHGKKTLLGMCKSIVGMANINAQELQEIKIMIPPIDLQNQFEKRYQHIKQIKSKVESQLLGSSNMFNSLIQKAFNGELVA